MDEGIVDAVQKGISWLKGEITDDFLKTNRRKVPVNLFNDRIALNLLMSSISTIIGGSMDCHNRLIKSRSQLLTNKADYINAMYDMLKQKLDDFTIVAINRGVQHYISTS